jgi:lipid-binding SYLF domain-containing protein
MGEHAPASALAPPHARLSRSCELPPTSTNADHQRCPQFLPRARAVILLRTFKAGFGLGVQRGNGLLLARLPPPPAALSSSSGGSLSPSGEWASQLSPASATDSAADSPLARPGSDGPGGAAAGWWGWSPPTFVSLTGISTGFTAGAHQATSLIGVMSESALRRLLSGGGGALCLGAEWSVAG